MSVEPGWYPDPADTTTQRYWDGEQWVGGAVPVGAEPPAVPPPAVPPPAAILPDPVGDRAPAGDRDLAGDRAPVEMPPHAAGTPADSLAGIGLGAPILLPAGLRPAAPILRLFARLIDILAVVALVALVNSYFFYRWYTLMKPQIDAMTVQLQGGPDAPVVPVSAEASQLLYLMTFTALALWFAYEVPATANTGQTLGKRMVGLRVEKLDGSTLTFWHATRRWMILAIPSLLPGCLGLPIQLVDCAWCTWDKPLRQTLHDKSAQTIVIVGGPRQPATPPED